MNNAMYPQKTYVEFDRTELHQCIIDLELFKVLLKHTFLHAKFLDNYFRSRYAAKLDFNFFSMAQYLHKKSSFQQKMTF